MSSLGRSGKPYRPKWSPEERFKPWSYRALTVIDVFLHVFVVSTFVIIIWRGSYELFVHYHKASYPWLAIVFCIVVQLILSFTGNPLIRYFNKPHKSRIAFLITSRAFIYAHFMTGLIVYVYQEQLLDTTILHFNLHEIVSETTATLVAIGILCMCRMVAVIMTPPACGLSFDPKPEEIFQFETMFRAQKSNTGYSCLYVLDSFFSVCIIGTLVVVVWRGVWAIMDKYLYPEQEQMSAWLSLVIGYSVVLVAFSLQYWVKNLVRRIKGIKRIIVVDIYLLFSFFGAVNVWRGIWNMLDVYFLPEAQVTSYWISHIACFIILVALNSSNSILVRGVYMDGEGDGTQCVDFPCYYVRLLVQKRKRKKNNVVEKEDKEMIQVKGNLEEEEEIEQSVMGKLLTNSVIKENGDIKANKNGENIKTIVQYDNNIV
ncbi:uncharacterized protein LOC126894043 isoform X1 [Daktulosphaira vitifoliae]|uniref:uncharacterized protein LOC126894043 isoform X1 n=1 Tax=Daktulosphaira vitifoliae TaxID=58002 RepID=UPI0021AADEFB|nr:uncharacterized protein LOC126894043 isoform X1 [Daktulosphaira vitifoliae]